MEKRVIVAIVLCVAVLMLWTKFFPAPRPVAPPPAAPVTAPAPSSFPQAPSSASPPPAAAPSAGGAAAAVANRAEQQVELVTPEVRFVLSTRGGTVRHAQLRDRTFWEHDADPASGHDVVRAQYGEGGLRTTFPGSGFAEPADSAWVVTQ